MRASVLCHGKTPKARPVFQSLQEQPCLVAEGEPGLSRKSSASSPLTDILPGKYQMSRNDRLSAED